jgi:hypothetical protein
MDPKMNALDQSFVSQENRPLARHQEIMLGIQGEQRSSTRFFNTAAAMIDADGVRHVGLVRDLSGNGLFVYSDFEPSPGSTVNLTLWLSKDNARNETLACRGKVVRVVSTQSGAAIGIGVALEDADLAVAIPGPETD